MKNKTNVQFVNELMEHSNQGALVQIFVMEALEQYAQKVKKVSKENFGSNGLINYEAYQRTADEVLEKLKQHLDSKI